MSWVEFSSTDEDVPGVGTVRSRSDRAITSTSPRATGRAALLSLMSQNGHFPRTRSSSKPKAGRDQYYIYADCACGFKGKASSKDGSTWTFCDVPACGSAAAAACAAGAPTTAATELVECNLCCDQTQSGISCAAGHHICGDCFATTVLEFNFTDRQKKLKSKAIEVPDLHTWPFMCYTCLEENICNLLPIGPCMSQMSAESTRTLFNMLRQFKLTEGDETARKEVDASELGTVRQMVALFFDPPRCPECLTPFAHDGGCMAMKCRGRPGVLCQVYFCLWCLQVPDQVMLLGPNASYQDCSDACHRHVFMCHHAPSQASLSGSGRLFPTPETWTESEKDDWIVAWLSLQAINKALKFLREFVAPNTAAAALAATDVAKLFADASELVTTVVQKFPRERTVFKLPPLKLDLKTRKVVVVSDSSSSDDDWLPLPPGRMQMRLPSPPPAIRRGPVHFPIRPPRPPIAAGQLAGDGDVTFIMEALSCNRRQATDALFASDGDPHKAIEDWFIYN